MIPSRRPLPQCFAVSSRADGRRALEQRAAGGNLFGEEVQVVRTGLHRNRQALGASQGQILERQRRGQMNNVQRETDICGKARSACGSRPAPTRRGASADRLGTAASRPHRRPGRDTRPTPRGPAGASRCGRVQADAASSSCLLDHGETFNAGIDQEALESGHSGLRQGRKVCVV